MKMDNNHDLFLFLLFPAVPRSRPDPDPLRKKKLCFARNESLKNDRFALSL
jgi:hypothetical protein